MDYTITRKDKSGVIVWSDDQIRYIIEEYQIKDRTLKSLSEEFKVQPQSIRNLLRKNKITITNKKIRDYPRDSGYFHIINSHEKAYWLGIILSDGSITNNNTISLGLKDKEHVEKFQKAIGAVNNKIIEIKDDRWSKFCVNYRFTMRDTQMAKDLAQYGCVNNKSYYNFSFPSLKEEYLFDFIRGYFDGDGSIYFTNNKYVISFVGHKEFLEALKVILGKEKLSLCQNSISKITYDLKICGKKDIQRILTLMYKNSTEETRLNRKYKIVQEVLNS